ncbi:hypothetical protein WA1_03600 [Scytonema hofmannii PCC 7110]|uniref:Peptidase C-terminal archaeal/bacterial domain-containing protein n=1 Tax=Scytonema hofmannii PCC 7110 TaxID=128403 RepID=A0A139X966_9CYAN|nr:pre-peptidase C-terminal domain-containing protein [Scytonema hofmannii]KYC41183.1 hypothetical protein WA1_03600 [Scytonema hofmannii PCC 7110]
MAVNLFDANYYKAANSDLAAAGITTNEQLLSHFQSFGLNEGRSFSPLVNLNFYRASNGDLTGMNNQQAFDHLSNYGVAEGRRFSPFVDLGFYKQVNGDLAALNFNNEQLFEHLSSFGVAEGRQFNPAFDITYYREVNPDLKAAKLNNSQLFEHFQFFGLTEGRVSSSAFNVKVYLANNADLVAAGFGNQQAYSHFLMNGQKEGRPGSDYAGNSLDSARIFPQSTSILAYSDFVGLGDTKDYYRISFDNLTNASLKLDSLTDNADARILDSTGKIIASSLNTGATSETINGTLEAGTYYIEVSSADSANTNYNLTLSTENPLSKAISLGELDGTNSLGKSSTLALSANDFYRFSVKTESTVNALLDGLNGDANLQVIWDVNKNGLVDKSDAIFSSAQSDTTPEQLKGFLPAGSDYYIRVISNTATPINYKVTLSTINQVQTTYNYYSGSGTPDQGTPALFFDSSFGGGTQTAVQGSSQLVSTTYGVAGYSKYDGGAVKLDRNNGYKLKFQVKLNTESHFGDNNGDKLDDNAGFNVTVASGDGKGIELGFWSNEIWAKNYDSASGSFALTHDTSEKATKNTTAMTNYELSVLGDNYQLFADNSYVLSGKLRDYSGIGEKYSLSNYFFLGDNSSSAKADVSIGSISLITLDPATMAN